MWSSQLIKRVYNIIGGMNNFSLSWVPHFDTLKTTSIKNKTPYYILIYLKKKKLRTYIEIPKLNNGVQNNPKL